MPSDRTSGDFGGKLREARERRGISLRQIANATKISVGVLDALERNDISRLPGGIFGRAFVRSYAVEVGLDPEQTIQDFIAQFPQDSVTVGHPASAQVEDTEALESDRRSVSTFLRIIMFSLPLAGIVLWLGASGRLASRNPSRERTVVPAPAPASDGPVAVPSSPTPAPTPAASQAPARSSGTQSPVPPRDSHFVVVLSASRSCRLSTTADGQTRERTLEAGARESFDVRRDLTITADDAGAIAMTINGVPAKPLGKTATPATVHLDLANFTSYLLPR